MKQISLLALAFAVVVAGCRKDELDSFDGPSLNDLYGPFSIVEGLTLSHQQINFAADGDLVFNAELSKNTNWVIEITGAQSGATRTIEGSDRLLSSDNAAWDGGANSFPGFSLEDAYIAISFPNEEDSTILRDTVTIAGTKIDDGILLTSFEDGIGTNWESFAQTTVTAGINCNDGNAASGSCYYKFEGAVPWDWAIGSVMVKPDDGDFGLPANASNLYFNMGFKATENFGPTNSFILFWFDEDDNGDGIFDPNTEDRFEYQYWSQNNEWDLISHKYADLQFDADGNTVEVNGNGLPEPSKLVAVNVFFLANQDNGLSSALVDHLIFTTDKPFTP